jgi:hypothetical protein
MTRWQTPLVVLDGLKSKGASAAVDKQSFQKASQLADAEN